jgi:hypothetical protein
MGRSKASSKFTGMEPSKNHIFDDHAMSNYILIDKTSDQSCRNLTMSPLHLAEKRPNKVCYFCLAPDDSIMPFTEDVRLEGEKKFEGFEVVFQVRKE